MRRRSCYYVDMRIVVTGDKDWSCPDLASRILRRLVARYGRNIIIVHDNETGVDSSFAAAATELGIAVEARVIDRRNPARRSRNQNDE